MTTWPIDKHASHCATVILFVELWQEAFHIATNCLESVELQSTTYTIRQLEICIT